LIVGISGVILSTNGADVIVPRDEKFLNNNKNRKLA